MSLVNVILVFSCKRKDTFVKNYLDLTTRQISMAKGSTNNHERSSDTFHEIETECSDAALGKIALLLKITQPGGRPLPMGVITERSIMALLTDATNYKPLGVTIKNNVDVVAEFGKGVRVFEIAQVLHSIGILDLEQISSRNSDFNVFKRTDC